MEKFGLFNALQTFYSSPDAANSKSSITEKLVSSFQAAERIASLFNHEPVQNKTEDDVSSAQSNSSASSFPDLPSDSLAEATSAATPDSTLQNDINESVPSVKIHNNSRGDAYVDFILKQEAFSKKIGGRK